MKHTFLNIIIPFVLICQNNYGQNVKAVNPTAAKQDTVATKKPYVNPYRAKILGSWTPDKGKTAIEITEGRILNYEESKKLRYSLKGSHMRIYHPDFVEKVSLSFDDDVLEMESSKYGKHRFKKSK